MTGMRGEPCSMLYQRIHVKTGKFEWICACDNSITNRCVGEPGEWCPLRGDPKYHIIQEK